MSPGPARRDRREILPRSEASQEGIHVVLGNTPQDQVPYDYPMVAPDYAEKRRDLAKRIGLGRKPAKKASAKTPAKRKTNRQNKS